MQLVASQKTISNSILEIGEERGCQPGGESGLVRKGVTKTTIEIKIHKSNKILKTDVLNLKQERDASRLI